MIIGRWQTNIFYVANCIKVEFEKKKKYTTANIGDMLLLLNKVMSAKTTVRALFLKMALSAYYVYCMAESLSSGVSETPIVNSC